MSEARGVQGRGVLSAGTILVCTRRTTSDWLGSGLRVMWINGKLGGFAEHMFLEMSCMHPLNHFPEGVSGAWSKRHRGRHTSARVCAMYIHHPPSDLQIDTLEFCRLTIEPSADAIRQPGFRQTWTEGFSVGCRFVCRIVCPSVRPCDGTGRCLYGHHDGEGRRPTC